MTFSTVDCQEHDFYICDYQFNDIGGVDTIYGGDGDDLIVGGVGATFLEVRAQLFAFEGHHDFGDIIRDFDGSDRLFFDQTIFASGYEVNQNFNSYFRFERVGSDTQVLVDKTAGGVARR